MGPWCPDEKGSDEVPGDPTDNDTEKEIFDEEYLVKSIWVHASGMVWKVPDGYPWDTDGESRSDNPHGTYEEEIENDIDDESNREYFDTLLNTSDSGEYLEIDLEEEIADDKKRRVLEDNPRHIEFISEEDSCNLSSEDEHKHTCHNSEDGEVLIKKRLDSTNFMFIPLTMKLGDDREEESNNRRDDDEGDSNNTEIVGIIPSITRSEDIDD